MFVAVVVNACLDREVVLGARDNGSGGYLRTQFMGHAFEGDNMSIRNRCCKVTLNI